MDPKLLNTNKSTRRNLGWAVILLLVVAVCLQYYKATRSHLGPGVLAPENPQIFSVNFSKSYSRDNYTIQPLASINMRARIISTKRYYWDTAANLSPIDVILGWGSLSDQKVLNNISVSQSDRDYSWKETGPLPVNETYINSHMGNFHLIPGNDAIKKVIKSLHSNEVVDLSGYLVAITGPQGFIWTSNLQHMGPNYGKILWVENISIVMK